MTIKTASKAKSEPKSYPIRYSVKEYTFPTEDTIEAVRFDDEFIHIELVDGRILSIPLTWIPPLRDAAPTEREKYKISPSRTAIIWDPDESEVNEILRLSDYLVTQAALAASCDYPLSPLLGPRPARVIRYASMEQPIRDRSGGLSAVRLDARRLAWLAVLAVATVALLVTLGGGRVTLDALRRVDVRLIALAAAVHYGGFALRGHRWQTLLAALGHRLGYRYTTSVLLAGWFVSALIPARAGDLLRVAALRLPPPSQSSVPAADGLASLFLERVLDLLAVLALSVGASLVVLGGRVPSWVLGAYGVALVLLAALTVAVLVAPSLLARARDAWSQPAWRAAWDFALQAAASLRRLPRDPRVTVLVVVESLTIWLCDGLLLWLVVMSLGYTLPLAASVFVALTVDVFAAVPLTPGGLGQIETAYAALLALLAQGGIPIAAAVLATRAISYWSFLLVSGLVTLGAGLGRLLSPGTPSTS